MAAMLGTSATSTPKRLAGTGTCTVLVVSEDSADGTRNERVRPLAPGERFVWTAMGICLGLAVTAAIIGLSMAFSKRVAPCQNGTFFPEGTKDFNCYVYPHAGIGSVMAISAVLLGTIVVFSALSAVESMRLRAHS